MAQPLQESADCFDVMEDACHFQDIETQKRFEQAFRQALDSDCFDAIAFFDDTCLNLPEKTEDFTHEEAMLFSYNSWFFHEFTKGFSPWTKDFVVKNAEMNSLQISKSFKATPNFITTTLLDTFENVISFIICQCTDKKIVKTTMLGYLTTAGRGLCIVPPDILWAAFRLKEPPWEQAAIAEFFGTYPECECHFTYVLRAKSATINQKVAAVLLEIADACKSHNNGHHNEKEWEDLLSFIAKETAEADETTAKICKPLASIVKKTGALPDGIIEESLQKAFEDASHCTLGSIVQEMANDV